ncbi:hypothetical protein L5515_010529 [Caenorhabditis briggsae]|uniref:BTB domain-containing protein n=1 Tax=Caenorhabditis briggsae TaxID=6238 RepID=A0AAE9ESV8_CAEBR|nr:hypothetical protein L5515_010529 [Caenorhabditis briggsae]
MSTTEENNFGITHVFKNIDGLAEQKEMVGNVEKHFGAFWAVKLYKYLDGDLRIGLNCEKFQSHDWSIKTNFDILVGGQSFRTGSYLFTQDEKNFYSMHISKNEFSNYEINKTATVEVRVRISETTGIMQIESKNFSDDVAKESSDVVLVVGDQKFFVSKMLLSFHSTYFKSLFNGNFSESGKSEIELKDIDPNVFQMFLEIIYGISVVEDEKISELLKLADFFNCQTAIDRCEEFLFFRSYQPYEFKFQAALKYKMETLKAKCYSGLSKNTDFSGLSPQDAHDYSPDDWKELFDKIVSLK